MDSPKNKILISIIHWAIVTIGCCLFLIAFFLDEDSMRRIPIFFRSPYNQITFLLIWIYSVSLLIYSKQKSILTTIPPFCTGVGVFFTFLVLFINLSKVDENGNPNFFSNKNNIPKETSIQENPKDSKKINETVELDLLVNNLSKAFSTSLIGIFFSLLFSPIVKFKISQIEENDVSKNKTTSVASAIQQHPHKLLFEQTQLLEQLLNSIQSLQGEKNHSITTLQETVYGLEEKISDETASLFGNVLTKISEELTSLGSISIKDAQEKVETINNAFIQSVEQLLSANSTKLEKVIEGFKLEIEKLSKQATQSNAEINTQVNGIQTAFGDSMNKMVEKIGDSTNQIEKAITDSKQRLTKLNDGVLESTQTILNENLAKIESAFERLEGFQATSKDNLAQTTKEFADAVNDYQEFTDQNKEFYGLIKTEIEQSKEATALNRKILLQHEELIEKMEDLNKRVSDLTNVVFHKSNGTTIPSDLPKN